MESLANAVGISRSTASRFFSGRATSLAVTLKILGKLALKFENVATVAEETPRRSRSLEEMPEAGTAAKAVGEVDAA